MSAEQGVREDAEREEGGGQEIEWKIRAQGERRPSSRVFWSKCTQVSPASVIQNFLLHKSFGTERVPSYVSQSVACHKLASPCTRICWLL
jgi:hypothetical protein